MHDVLIVGAGPTGLMLANQLVLRRGIRATIVDRHSGPAEQSRAMAVHARTLEIYQKLGIADQALAAGTTRQRRQSLERWAQESTPPGGGHRRGQSRYPFVLMLGQDDNERIMGPAAASGRDGSGTPSSLFRQQPDSVDVTIRQADGTTREIMAS